MALAFVFLFFSLFLTPASILANHEKIPQDNLEALYNTIMRHQKQANVLNAIYAPFPTNPMDLHKLFHDRKINGVTLEFITQIYPFFENKQKYSGKDILEGFNLDSINLTVFHRYEDIKVGKKFPLLFANQGPPSAVFHAKSQPNIINPYANNAALCGAAVDGEQKTCVGSLEEMLVFVKEMLGTKVKPLLTRSGKWQQYTVAGEARTVSFDVSGCHKMNYPPFGVYGCHHVKNSRVRVVPLVGEDGTRLEAVTVCHMDTSSWSPHHLLFRLIKAQPGVPICHFQATDDILWVPE